MTEPRLTRWRRRIDPFLPGLIGTAVLAVLCNLALELSRLTGLERYPWQHKTPAFIGLFVLGSIVWWMLIGLVHAVVGRLTATTALTVTVTAVVAVADYEKVKHRREPLYPNDWALAGDLDFLTQMIGIRLFLLFALGILAMAGLAFVAARAVRRRFPGAQPQTRDPRKRRTRAVVRMLTAGLCLLGMGYLSNFNSPGNAARGTYEALGASWRPWSQQKNYLGNGFVGGFLYNLDVPAMPKPAGYGAAEIARISATYTEAAERINRTREPGGLEDVNVVMILSESFSDPGELDGVRVAEDPIPFTRRLMRSTMSGKMLAQNIGGGTANMEFETLTGMSMSQFPPQTRVPYQMVIPGRETFPSALTWLKRDGHRAVAMHPFTTEMYRRRDVYPILGFDEFVYDRKMLNNRRIGRAGYISDSAAFDDLQHRLESERRPLFVNLVTMQNHIPYVGRYADPALVTGPDSESLSEIGQYVRGLAHTDEALKELIGRLSRFEEKTVVVFYGDHLPGSYPDSVVEANSTRDMHQTPFFVWANFAGPDEAQPITSPTHFMDLVLERTGAAVPPYYALLHELRQEIPAMDSGMLFDSASRRVRPGELTDRAARLLRDYRMVQYDLAVGKRYSEDAMLGSTSGR